MVTNYMGNYKMGAEQKESQPTGNCVRILHGILLALRGKVKLMLMDYSMVKGHRWDIFTVNHEPRE